MPIRFEAGNVLHNLNFNYANRRAAKRQTEEQRNRIFSKFQDLVGLKYKNTLSARRAANAELRKLPEYWDEDQTPRLPLHITSSCIARVIPSAGGVFLYFQSNPNKGYFYPSAGTTAETAKRIYDLVSSPSLGTTLHEFWGEQNGAKKRITKAGNIDYGIKFPKSPKL